VNRDKAQPHNALRFASLPAWKSLWNCVITAAEMATLCRSNIRLLFLFNKTLFFLSCFPIYVWFSQEISSPKYFRLPFIYFSSMRSTQLGHLILLDLIIVVSSDEQHQLINTSSYCFFCSSVTSGPLGSKTFPLHPSLVPPQFFCLPFCCY